MEHGPQDGDERTGQHGRETQAAAEGQQGEGKRQRVGKGREIHWRNKMVNIRCISPLTAICIQYVHVFGSNQVV